MPQPPWLLDIIRCPQTGERLLAQGNAFFGPTENPIQFLTEFPAWFTHRTRLAKIQSGNGSTIGSPQSMT